MSPALIRGVAEHLPKARITFDIFDALISQAAAKRTARAWLYREGLWTILDRKQINVVAAMLKQWCANVLRSKSLPSRKRRSCQ
jgi:hypothetical protein